MIPEGAIVSRGDSVTLQQMGIIPALKERNQNSIIDALGRNTDGSRVFEAEECLRMQ